MNELSTIRQKLEGMLTAHQPHLQVSKRSDTNLEVSGTKEVMQGKKKVDAHYFASVMPKPKDVRFYFFPIYTHADAFEGIPASLRKCLKGKSCFHIKTMDAELETAINAMVDKGVQLYLKDELI
jgi:hypothetical protein